jgi:PKD-like domain/CS domain
MKNFTKKMLKSTKVCILSLVFILCGNALFAQKVIIVGATYNNVGTDFDRVAFVVNTPLVNGDVIYVCDYEYNNSTNVFGDGGTATLTETIIKFTANTSIAKGQVVELSFLPTQSNQTVTVLCTSGSACGTATLINSIGGGTNNFRGGGESLYAYSDTDDNPTNGVTEIFSVMFVGDESATGAGGNIGSTENPVSDFPNCVVIDGFTGNNASPVGRVEFNASRSASVSKAMLENTSNYTAMGTAVQALDRTAFSNLNLAGTNPVLTLAVAPTSVTENGSPNLVYTFTLSANAASNITVNFSVGGTATFNTDYAQTGAATFSASAGTVTIPSGSNTASVTINPSGDATLEPDETVILTVTTGTGYDAGSPSAATGTITNDDTDAVLPKIAISGINHGSAVGDIESFSFVALEDITAGTVFYFTEHNYDKSLLTFSNSGAFTISWTAPANVNRGDVYVVTETTNAGTAFTVTCSDGSGCGTVALVNGSMSFSLDGETFMAYSDGDNNPFNGVGQIHSVLHTGTAGTPGGVLPSANNPSSVYTNVVIADNFPATSPIRTEYKFANNERATTVSRTLFTNIANWVHAGSLQTVSTTRFTNITITNGVANPLLTVAVSPSSVVEDGVTNLAYTFTLSQNAASNITVNFTVGGTATFNTDYTQTGATTFSATAGSVVIPSGSNSATVTINPTAETTLEANETVVLTIDVGTGYDAGTPNDATGTITNDDVSVVNPVVALVGMNAGTINVATDGFSFAANQNLAAGTEIYFTDLDFNNTTLKFTSSSEFVIKYTVAAGGLAKGQVVSIQETGEATNAYTVNCSAGSNCGTVAHISGDFAFPAGGDNLYAYSDGNGDPTDGITVIHSLLHTINTSIPSTQQPTTVYPNAVVISGFGSAAPNRTEYKFASGERAMTINLANIQNTSNWLIAQAAQALSVVPFTALDLCPASITANPSNRSICPLASTTFSVTATGAIVYQWQVDTGSGFTNISDGGVYSGATTTTLTLTNVPASQNGYLYRCVVNDCATSTAATLTINALPVPAPSSNSPVCSGNTLNLTSAASTSYSWAGPNSFTSTLRNPSISNISIVAGGTYSITQTNSSNCTAIVTIMVTVNQTPNAGASNNSPVNVGGTLNLNGTGNGTYFWTGPNTFTSSAQNPVRTGVTNAEGGTYTLTVTNTGCTATATTVVVINEFTASNNSPVCEGSTINLSASGGNSYTWTGPNTFTSTDQNPSISNATLLKGGVYSVVITNSTASATTALTTRVIVNSLPELPEYTGNTACVGSPLQLSTSNPEYALPGTFSWTGPNGYSSSDAFPLISSSATVGLSGTYSVMVTTSANCTATGTVLVTVNAISTATATPSTQTICSGGAITTIAITGTGTSYTWTRNNTAEVTGIAASGSGNISGSLTNTTNAPITVTFTITPEGACSGTPITATVVVNPIPTATASTPSQSICSGQNIAGINLSNFVGEGATNPNSSEDDNIKPKDKPKDGGGITLNASVVGTVFNWTRDNTATVGGTIGASGSGNIFGSLTNTTTSPITVTFTITPSYTNAGTTCTGTPITVTVTVNPNPTATITDAGTAFCQSGSTTLSANANPNFTYVWQRSFSGIANPNSYTAFGGTAQTQVVSTSGNYRVIVTNQYNCSASDTAAIHFADFIFNGSLGAGDAQQTGRMSRFGVVSTCAAPKGYPGTFDTGGQRFYDSYTITNPVNVPVCATIGIKSGCGVSMFSAAYINSFNPANIEANYLADPGSSFPNTGFYEATIPANGTIVVVVHEVNTGTGCGNYTLTVELPREPLGITVTPNSSICAGTPVSLIASKANSYAWTGGGTFSTQTINPSPTVTTTYNVNLGYGNGTCNATASAQVVVNPIPTASSNSPVCAGGTLNLSSGTATSYSWTSPSGFTSSAQNPSIPNVSASQGGVYTVVTVSGGCTSTATVNVVINALPIAMATSNSPVCAGGSLSINTTAGNNTYTWAGPNGFDSDIQNPVIPNITTAANGTYTVTVLSNDNGCTNTSTVAVTINALPTATASSNSPICSGATLNLTSGGGGSYTWTGPAIHPMISTTQNPSISNVATSATGVYTVMVTNNGCTSTATIAVVINANPTATASSSTPTICAGNTISLSGGGVGTYAWTGVNGFSSTNQNPTITNASILASGTYKITVTNVPGCTSTATTSITVNALPTAIASSNSPICSGTTLNLTGGGVGTAYAWTSSNGFTSTAQSPTITNATVSATGTYTITVTNANGCTSTASVAVTVNALPTATASSNSPICSGTTLNLTGGGIGTYAWTSTNGFTSTDQNPTISNASVSATGTYTITVTNAAGCTSTASVAVTVNALPTATASSNSPICAGTTLNLTGGGVGTAYAWTSSNGFTSTAQSPTISNASVSSTGTYTITVTNANGCTSMASVAVTVNALPTATASSNSPICSGATLNLTGGGIGTYAWTSTNGFTSTDQNPTISNASVSATGTYTITVTNAAGCTSTASVAVTVNALPTATASSNSPICAGTTLNLTGGGVGTAYAWTSSNGFTSTAQSPTISNASVSSTGTYTITVTNANGCTSTASVAVTVNALPTATASSNSPICSGTTLNLTGGGIGTYAWTSSNGFTSTEQSPTISNASVSATGTYTITVTNAAGCTSTASVAVIVNPTPATPTTQADTQIIFGGSVSLTATGCSGVNDVLKWYQTVDNMQVTMPVSPTATTQYYAKCEVTANGITCISQNSNNVTVTVLQPQPPVATGATICTGESVTLTATGCSGSTGTFVLKWYQNADDALVTMPVSPTTNTDYYAKCEQTFNSVTAISAKSNVVTVTVLSPVAPVATGGTIYSGNSITLTATGCTGSGFVIKWYQTADNVEVTMPVSPTVATQYYAKCEQTANSVTCASVKSNDVTVTVVNRIFVDITKIAAPIQNGNSWATAYGNLQTGLSAAAAVVVSAPAEVWVAQGTYKPTTTTTRTIYFNIPSGVKVYGGFAGTENDLATRNFRTNITTLSGDIGTQNLFDDNSYHVVVFDGSSTATLLDGFTITGGYANFDPKRVGLVPSAPSSSTIETGGGITVQNAGMPTIANCTIINNAAVTGGGVYAGDASLPKIIACKITSNQATFGAGIYFQDGSNGSINNTLISGNKGIGAVYNNTSSPTITNCTIAGNGGYNGGIFNSVSQPVVKNSIIWNNSTPFNDTQSIITYSTVQGGYAGTGNLSFDPKFVNPVPDGLAPNANGDYHLQSSSLAIDRGDNAGISLTDVDLDGNLRRFNGDTVDMGAFEFQGSPTSNLVISAQTGDWEISSTWVGFKVPALGDVVIIDSNHIVTIKTTATAKSIEYRGTGQVKFNSNTAKLNIGF